MLRATHDWQGGTGWDVAHELARPDVEMLVQETVSRHRVAEPERRLLLAVLLDAIVCVQRRATMPAGPRRAELHEAERWIRSNDLSWPCSFVNVCEALGLAHEPLRRALLRSQAAGFSKREVAVGCGL
jgi:hypothetical protein